MREFIGNFLRNLAILAVIAFVLLIMFPDMMSQVYGVFGALGPTFVLLFIIAAALPGRRRSRN